MLRQSSARFDPAVVHPWMHVHRSTSFALQWLSCGVGLCFRFVAAERYNGQWAMAGVAGILGQVMALNWAFVGLLNVILSSGLH